MSFFDDETAFSQWNANNSNPNAGFQNWAQGANQADLIAYGSLPESQQQNFINKMNTSGTDGFGFNNSTLSAGGAVLSGLGSLANAWAGLQGVKLGEKQLGVQQDQWNKNYESQATTINNRIADQNAWKAAQGRTDLGTLVPKYNIG